jgi:hypothetical protein
LASFVTFGDVCSRLVAGNDWSMIGWAASLSVSLSRPVNRRMTEVIGDVSIGGNARVSAIPVRKRVNFSQPMMEACTGFKRFIGIVLKRGRSKGYRGLLLPAWYEGWSWRRRLDHKVGVCVQNYE